MQRRDICIIYAGGLWPPAWSTCADLRRWDASSAKPTACWVWCFLPSLAWQPKGHHAQETRQHEHGIHARGHGELVVLLWQAPRWAPQHPGPLHGTAVGAAQHVHLAQRDDKVAAVVGLDLAGR